MNSIRATLATVWRIAIPYFRSEDRLMGRVLLSAVIAIELAVVGLNVLFNQWNNTFYNALQERDEKTFAYQIGYFCVLATIFIMLKVYQLYLNQWLQIRWRRWMTDHYLDLWLRNANHYRMQLQGDAADNPDQRIADDTKMFVEQTLTLGIGLLSAFVTLASFVVILWGLSEAAPLHLANRDFAIPGYLVWGALIYAILGTALTYWIGWPLVGLSFTQQRYEADFRFNLVRARENAEQIALLRGETVERGRLSERFASVVDNFIGIMRRTKKLTAFTAAYSQASVIFPYILVAPAYFANKVQLGGLMQTASAFSSVQDSLSFFVAAYRDRSLPEWQAVVARLAGFEAAIADAESLARDAQLATSAEGDAIALRDVEVALPTGAPLASAKTFSFATHRATLVTGPSGAGKSTLFRAISGIWPFGRGRITIPADAKIMTLPQRPYFPVGPLDAAVAYPSPVEAFGADAIGTVLNQVGLPALGARLHESGHWNRTLSLGEQQRLGIARALLQKPDYLLLDEATASLDEPSEAALYRLLTDALPETTLISIGHRATLDGFHQRKVSFEKTASGYTLRDSALAPS